MTSKPVPSTALCHATADRIEIRGRDLCGDLIGKVDFVQMMMFEIFGRMPTPVESQVVTAVMVAIMEHGLTASTISARMIYSSAPEAIQGAMAAGLLAGGSVMRGLLLVSRAAGLVAHILEENRNSLTLSMMKNIEASIPYRRE